MNVDRYAFQSASRLYLLTDFFGGGELLEHIRRLGKFTEAQARFFVAEVQQTPLKRSKIRNLMNLLEFLLKCPFKSIKLYIYIPIKTLELLQKVS